MTKTIIATGPNGTITGNVHVQMNFRSELQDASKIYFHFVSGYINGKMLWSNETTQEYAVLDMAKEIEVKMEEALIYLANKKEKTVKEMLQEAGYK